VDEKQAAELLGKYFQDVQTTALKLVDALSQMDVSSDVKNAALAMALALSTKQAGMSEEESIKRFGMSLRHVHTRRPTWQ